MIKQALHIPDEATLINVQPNSDVYPPEYLYFSFESADVPDGVHECSPNVMQHYQPEERTYTWDWNIEKDPE
jgi:hypothetical protein